MHTLEITTGNEAETQQLAEDIAIVLVRGDLITLSGDLGSGKSVIARAIIRKLAGDPELEVPSPTFTLCNIYETVPRIGHFDLYRVEHEEELNEIGLDEILDLGCGIIEWPDRAPSLATEQCVRIEIKSENEIQRRLLISGSGETFERVMRSLNIRKFLCENGFEYAQRHPFSADASARRYETITDKDSVGWYLMDAPAQADGPVVRDGKPYSQIAHLAEDMSAFVAIGNLLRLHKFSAPEIPAFDLSKGFALVEDLGNSLIIDENRAPIPDRYLGAAELLFHMHQQRYSNRIEVPDLGIYHIPEYDRDAMMIEVELMLDWYLPTTGSIHDDPDKRVKFHQIWTTLIDELQGQPKTLVLRDYHSPNIIWRAGHKGVDRIGLIDFQDAVMGPAAYDVASLAQDARVDVSTELEDLIVEHYEAGMLNQDPGFDITGFRKAYAIMAAQRATKILGIFVRLDVRDGKSDYLRHIPRIKNYLRRSTKHPVLADYRELLEGVI